MQTEVHKLFVPTLKISNAQEVERQRKYGPKDEDYFWYRHPHEMEYQKTLKLKIFCEFDFGWYPFDNHICDLKYGPSSDPNISVRSLPPMLRFQNKLIDLFGNGSLDIKETRIPFHILMESINTFNHFEAGIYYSYCGVRFYFKRKDMGLLLGSFYVPTLCFSILSMISFFIHPDQVS